MKQEERVNEVRARQPINLDVRQEQPNISTVAVDLQSPSADRTTLLYVYNPLNIREIAALVEGSTPTATWNLEYSNDVSVFSSLFTTAITTSSTTTTKLYYPDVKYVPSGHWLWLNLSATGGTLDHLHLAVIYEQ